MRTTLHMLNDISYIPAEKELQLLVITMRVFLCLCDREEKESEEI